MKYVVALDVSMGKSYMVVYNANQFCERTGEILHTRTGFQELKTLLTNLTATSGEPPAIVFEATGVYSRPLERFFEDCQYEYCLLNPLEAKIQTDPCACIKQIRATRTVWLKLISMQLGVPRKVLQVYFGS